MFWFVFGARGLIRVEGSGVAQSRNVSLSLQIPETQIIIVRSLFSGLCFPLQILTVAGPRQDEQRIRAMVFAGEDTFGPKDVTAEFCGIAGAELLT